MDIRGTCPNCLYSGKFKYSLGGSLFWEVIFCILNPWLGLLAIFARSCDVIYTCPRCGSRIDYYYTEVKPIDPENYTVREKSFIITKRNGRKKQVTVEVHFKS